jgi:hypothetical protein
MRHLKSVNQKAQRIQSTLENDVVALQQGGAPTGPHVPLGCSFVFSPGWEVDSNGGTGRVVPASRTRSVRLLPDLLLAGARARPLQSRARLDREMRVRAEGLAQDRPDLPMSRAAAGLIALSLAVSVAGAQGTSARPDPVTPGGNGTIYVGTYARNILVLDEATMRVRDTIKPNVGIPELSLSFDRKKLYVTDPGNEKLEIIDLATKQSSGVMTLSKDSMKVRMWGFSLDPKDRFAIMLVKTYTKKLDRYEVGRPTLLRYDLAKRAVTDTIAWPRGEEREGAQILFSPKGDLMYFFTQDDVLIYDTNTLKEVDRWEISKDAVRGRTRQNQLRISVRRV